MPLVGGALGSVPTAAEGEELDEKMYTYCVLFCSYDPTGETLKIATKPFSGKVRYFASKGLIWLCGHISFFSYCCDQICDKSNLRKRGFILARGYRVWPSWGKDMVAGMETASHIVPAVRK